MNIFVTGGCGFIGSNFIRFVLGARKDARVMNIDNLTYAGNLSNLTDIEERWPDRYRFIKGDIGDKAEIEALFEGNDIDWLVNFAAESHVDRSILGPEIFIRTNIFGTFSLLEACLKQWPVNDPTAMKQKRFLHISTDEVYGSLGESGAFQETTPYDPSSPYSASKASSDHLVKSYYRTYGLPVLLTHCTNNYGPYQFPEKLIPLMIKNAKDGIELPLYGDGENVRDWIYVEDHCEALLKVLEEGELGESYNIGGNCEKQNKEIVFLICDQLDKILGMREGRPRRSLIRYVTDRPGHDRRYAMDISKITRQLGWKPRFTFEDGMERTLTWYLENPQWVEEILDGSYLEFYNRQYGERLGESKK